MFEGRLVILSSVWSVSPWGIGAWPRGHAGSLGAHARWCPSFPPLHLWAAEADRSDLQTSYFGEFSVIFGRFRELKAVFHQLDIEFILRHLISNAFRYLTVPQGPKIHESGKINFNWTYDWALWSLVHCIFTIIFLVGCLIFAFIVFERLSFFCRAFLMIGLSRATYFPMQFDLKSKLKLWSPGPKKWSPGPPA